MASKVVLVVLKIIDMAVSLISVEKANVGFWLFDVEGFEALWDIFIIFIII